MTGTTRPRAVLVLAIAFALFASSTVAGAIQDVRPSDDECVRDARKLPREAGRSGHATLRPATKVRHVPLAYPALTPGTTGRGIWIGTALIDAKGKVVRVWTIRDVKITPPTPGFTKAITDAIRQWEYWPLGINGVAEPACQTVTVSVDLESIAANPRRK